MKGAVTDYLRRRDEVLQVLYWMAGEGLGTSVPMAQLCVFLGDDEDLADVLAEMVTEALVTVGPEGTYALTPTGRQLGGRCFALEFEGMVKQAHGECAPGCGCLIGGPDHATG